MCAGVEVVIVMGHDIEQERRRAVGCESQRDAEQPPSSESSLGIVREVEREVLHGATGTPQTESVVVLFKVTLLPGCADDYLARAGELKHYLTAQDGFLGSERFSSLSEEGKLLSLSRWRDETSIARWRNHMQHRAAQRAGRERDFANYRITVAAPVRVYSLNDRTEAPEDSRVCFDM